MQVAKQPATNRQGLSLVRFEKHEDISGTKENDKGEYNYAFTKLSFVAMDKQKKYTVPADVVGKYGAAKDPSLTLTIEAMGYQQQELDLDNLDSADEADDFSDGTEEATGEVLDAEEQRLIVFLDSCVGKSYWVKLVVNSRGRYTLDHTTLTAFVKP